MVQKKKSEASMTIRLGRQVKRPRDVASIAKIETTTEPRGDDLRFSLSRFFALAVEVLA